MAIFLALVIGILWSLFDFIRKQSLKYFNENEVLTVVILSQTILFSVLLLFSDFTIDSNYYYIYYIPLITLGLLAFYLFLKVLKNSEISLTIPLLSFTPLFSSLYAFFILNETLSHMNYIGILIIVLGSLLLYSKTFSLKDIFASPIALYKNHNAKLMLLVALIWSLTPVLDKKCLQYTDVYLHGYFQSIGWIIIIPYFFLNKKISLSNLTNRNTKHLIAGIAIIGSVVSLTQLIALTYNMVPILESFKRSIGIILSLVFGYYFFKEKVNFKKTISVIIMVSGLYLLIN